MSKKVAKVVVDSGVPHLDHVFDYLIPDKLIDTVKIGIRVRVPFRKQRLDGYVVGVEEVSNYIGKLVELENVISPEVVLTDEILTLCRMVAFRNVGNLHDVLKVAVPPRHKRAESKFIESNEDINNGILGSIEKYPQLNSFLNADNKSQFCVLNHSITDSYDDFIIDIVNLGINNTIFLLPDQFDVKRVIDKFSMSTKKSRIAAVTSALPPEARYYEFLKVLRGQCDLVIGTRNAIYAPLNNLKNIFVFDDGDDLYTSPQAPYWNAREVAIWRAEISNLKIILASRAQSIESRYILNSGSAIEVNPKSTSTEILGRVVDEISDNYSSLRLRMPTDAFNLIRKSLATGSVLISIPHKGYFPAVRCVNCHQVLICSNCKTKVALGKNTNRIECTRCGITDMTKECHKCGGRNFRPIALGVERTAEELGKAFANASVKFLDHENRVDVVEKPNQIVIATPGVEPNIKFSGILVLDSHIFLSRPEGNSRIRFIRHLFSLRSKVKTGGEILVVGDPSDTLLQAFVKNNQINVAEALLKERVETKLNPYSRTAQLLGDWSALNELRKDLPEFAQVWGPVANTIMHIEKHPASILISFPKNYSEKLVKILRSWVVARSVNRKTSVVVRIDPDDL